MPFIHTQVPSIMQKSQIERVVHGIHNALVSAIGMPTDELFNRVHRYQPDEFWFSKTFNGVQRSEQVVVVEITLRRGRSDAMKRDLCALVAQNLERDANIRPADVMVFCHENDHSDWSVGHGQMAMALVQQVHRS